MRQLLILGMALLAFSCIAVAPAFGQIEFSGGYSFMRTGYKYGPGDNLNGWDASVATHLIGGLGLEADFSGQYASPDRHVYTELYGPRFEFLSFPRVEPYVHALIGTVHAAGFSSSQTSFGIAAGGGIEIKFTRHIWIRPFQLDYIHYRFGGPVYAGRYSAGVVFRFGKW